MVYQLVQTVEGWLEMTNAVHRALSLSVLFALGSVGVVGCASPPTVGSLAVDRANDVVEEILSAPTSDQEAIFIRELVREYQQIGGTITESDISAADRGAMITAGIKTCRELADGVSIASMRQKMEQDLLQQSPELDSTTAAGIIQANLAAIRAPGSLCP